MSVTTRLLVTRYWSLVTGCWFLVTVRLAAQIPLKPGMVLNYSHLQTDRNYDKEFLVTVLSVDSNQTVFQNYFLDEVGKFTLYPDTVSRREWLGARAVGVGTGSNLVEHVRNRTVMALGKRVYQQLKQNGRVDEVATYIVFPGIAQRVQGSLELVGTDTMTVVIDSKPVTVHALHTKGHFTRMVPPMLDVPAENWYLDDAELPWVLRIEQEISGKQYHVRIGTVETTPASSAAALESALKSKPCRAEVYGVYFGYDSAVIPPVSEPTLAQVAQVLKQHGDWSITIEGHTDSIGGAKYNQELSARRAAAVKQRLIEKYGIAAARLNTSGIGLAKPLATNATQAGRARNRRGELVRACG